jgi:hypothetical protein
MSYEDPLWKLRHALAGVGLALLLSVFAAAFAGSALGDLFGGGYGTRVAVYGGLLLYVVVGAGVLFVKVAQHDTTPLSFARVAKWFTSLWLWPLLMLSARRREP